jgi:hypothetical protein
MSLDIWLTDTVETTVVDKNITHNLGRMWSEAGVYDALYNSEGQTAKSVLPILHEGLRLMIADPERFKKFNAHNGWGLYEHALPWLGELIKEFEEYPNGIIGVSK